MSEDTTAIVGEDLRARNAIRMPAKITCDDGRVLSIISWEPRVAVDEVVTVKVNAMIEVVRE